MLTTRELAWMIKSYGIDFVNLPDGEFDRPLGISSGAADIFGATGGVMEAALRTAAVKLTGEELGPLVFENVRGVTGLKEATLTIAGKEINIAVSDGLTNAKTILEHIRSGKKAYHLVEIMACPGGCIAGGGQPYPPFHMDVLDPEAAQAPRQGPLQDGQQQATPPFPRESRHRAPLRGLPRGAQRREGPRTPPHPLPRPHA